MAMSGVKLWKRKIESMMTSKVLFVFNIDRGFFIHTPSQAESEPKRWVSSM